MHKFVGLLDKCDSHWNNSDNDNNKYNLPQQTRQKKNF